VTGARITVAFDHRATVQRFQRLSGLLVNTTPIMKAIGVVLVRNTEDRFTAGRAPDGTPWKPLLPAYAAIKRGPSILVASGMLRRSITFAAGQNNVVIGSNRVYAAVHQFGGVIRAKTANGLFFFLGGAGPNLPTASGKKTKAGVKVGVHVQSVTIPARPYLGLSVIDQRDVIETVDGFILRPLTGS
jgi:phage virion morphogenesis protein